MAIMSNVFLHLHPWPCAKAASDCRSRGAWAGCVLPVLAEVITGVLLMFYYRPTVQYAYQDIQGFAGPRDVGLMREIHRWGQHAMIITNLAGI